MSAPSQRGSPAWLAALVALSGGCVFNAPRYEGPPSEHFDGERFSNQAPRASGSFRRFVQWRISREPGPWERRQREPGPPPPARVEGDELRVTFVNHATVLIQTRGLNLLTDPIWSERCSPLSWIGPRRYVSPGLRWEDLPPIDAVLISHNHYDHLDVETLRRLAEAHQPRFLVPLGNAALFAEEDLPGAEDFDWWQTTRLGALELTFVPAQHFSGRGTGDRDATLWGGWSLSSEAGHEVFFAGDTGYGPHFAQVHQRLGPPRLALLPIGAYEPRWFMGPVHIDPDEAVRVHLELEATTSVAIHFGTFALADEGQDQPAEELARVRAARGVAPERFVVLAEGQALSAPRRAALSRRE